LRSLITASSRRRSGGESEMEIPVRMPHARTHRLEAESPKGLFC
jgi:hypothetical protein